MAKRKSKEYKVKNFSDWLKGEMRKQNITQEDVGKYIGITQQKVSERLSGHTPFKLDEIVAIFELLGTDVETAGQLFII